MLRGVGIADGEVGLEEIEARGGTVALGIVARGDELDNFGDVAVHTEVAGDGDEDIGAVTGGGEDFFVEGEGAGEILGGELVAGGGEVGFDSAGRSGGGSR